MKNYTITKEQILEVDKLIIQEREDTLRDKLNEWFPEAFKKELEIGKWYIMDGNKCGQSGRNLIANFSGKEENANYGFDFLGIWSTELCLWNNGLGNQIQEATPEEIQSALKKHAIQIGFKGGIKIDRTKMSSNTDSVKIPLGINFFYDFNFDILYLNEKEIYNRGVWAEILPEETNVEVPVIEEEKTFEVELRSLINRHSKENDSDTPDFILAKYLKKSLKNFNKATNKRSKYYNK